MAYDFFGQDEEDQKLNDPMNVQLGQESPVVTGGGQKVQEAGSPKGTRSGQYTNLQQYLDANKSLGFGQKVADRVGGKVQTATSALDDTDRSFRADSDASSVDKDDALIGRIGTDATGLVGNADDFAKVQKMRDARYQGPNDFASYGTYGSTLDATTKAQQAAEATKSEGGRKTLLDQEFGSGAGRYDYTGGQKRLDNLLIQNDPASRQAFQNVQQQAQAAQQRFSDLGQALDAYAAQNKAKTTAARSATRGAIGIDDAGNVLETGPGAIQTARGALDTRVAQEKKNRDDLKAGTDALGVPKTWSDVKDTATGKPWVDPNAQYQGMNIGNAWAFGGVADPYRSQDLASQYKDATGKDPWSTSLLYSNPRDYRPSGELEDGRTASQFDWSGVVPMRGADQSFMGLNFNDPRYLQYAADTAFNRDAVAGTQDIAKMRALEQLAALDPKTLLAAESAGRFSDEGKAGKQVWEPYVDKLDKLGMYSDLQGRKAALDTDVRAAARDFRVTSSDPYLQGLDPADAFEGRTPGSYGTPYQQALGRWQDDNVARWKAATDAIRKKYGLG